MNTCIKCSEPAKGPRSDFCVKHAPKLRRYPSIKCNMHLFLATRKHQTTRVTQEQIGHQYCKNHPERLARTAGLCSGCYRKHGLGTSPS